MRQPILVTTTTSNQQEAAAISRLLVESGLAACVNIIGPIQSVYSWQGKITEDSEYKLFIKSFQDKWDAIQTAIKKNHSYNVPEISMIHIEDMQPDYLKWMGDVVK